MEINKPTTMILTVDDHQAITKTQQLIGLLVHHEQTHGHSHHLTMWKNTIHVFQACINTCRVDMQILSNFVYVMHELNIPDNIVVCFTHNYNECTKQKCIKLAEEIWQYVAKIAMTQTKYLDAIMISRKNTMHRMITPHLNNLKNNCEHINIVVIESLPSLYSFLDTGISGESARSSYVVVTDEHDINEYNLWNFPFQKFDVNSGMFLTCINTPTRVYIHRFGTNQQFIERIELTTDQTQRFITTSYMDIKTILCHDFCDTVFKDKSRMFRFYNRDNCLVHTAYELRPGFFISKNCSGNIMFSSLRQSMGLYRAVRFEKW